MMISSLHIFTIIFLIIFGNIEVSNGALRCLYRDLTNKIQLAGYTPGYTCRLHIDGENNNWQMITGSHDPNKNDEKVKFIKKYFDFHANSKGLFEYELRVFSSVLCSKFVNLQGIFLYNNGIQIIEGNALDNCINLQNLNIGSNKINNVDQNMLKNTKKLKNLFLNNNNLTLLQESFLSSHSKLEILDLSKNQIATLPDNIFENLSSLQKLKLEHNIIEKLSPKWLTNLNKLEELDLSYNNINQLPTVPLNSSINIKSLSFNNNKIKRLNRKFFNKLNKLEVLDLSSNKINNLPEYIFFGLTSLKFFMISYNQLSVVHSKSFGKRFHLKTANFDGNIINYIDKQFVDKTSVSKIMMTGNFCSKEAIIYRTEMMHKLEECFENYDDTYSTTETYNMEKCGNQKFLRQTVVMGQNVSRGEYPWVVSIERINFGFICGSTLISKRTIITAGHCIKVKLTDLEIQASELKALVGAYDLKEVRETGAYPVAIKSTFVHPKWNQNSKSFDADVAILEMDHEIIYTAYIRPICLMDPTSDLTQISTGIVVGYGMDENGIYGTKPKLMTSPIIDHNECIKINEDLEDLISNRVFCGGYGNGTGACVGDSGSGFVVVHKNTFYLRGIVSSSLSDSESVCNVQTHSVFTDVLKFHLWIKFTMSRIHSSTEEEREHYDHLIKNNL